MKRRIKVGFVYACLSFVVVFLVRLGWGYLSYPEGQGHPLVDNTSQLIASFENSRKNYASDKMKLDSGELTYNVDQKYEKVATLAARTDAFDSDEKRVRDAIGRHQALIQFEQNSGLQGARILQLGIGVHPDRFDTMTTDLKKIGELISFQTDKTDKTNEYRELQARRVSLEKARDALVQLKKSGGGVAVLINLENRILEVENEIQSLGVRLGEFDQENEFCTIKLTLHEATASAAIPLMQRVGVALRWTVEFYLALGALVISMGLCVLILVLLLEKLKWIPSAASRYIDSHE